MWYLVCLGNALAPVASSRCSKPAITSSPRNWPISLLSPVALSGKIGGEDFAANLDNLNPEELRALTAQLMQRVETMDKQINHHKSVKEKLAHEITLLNRFKFAKRSK